MCVSDVSGKGGGRNGNIHSTVHSPIPCLYCMIWGILNEEFLICLSKCEWRQAYVAFELGSGFLDPTSGVLGGEGGGLVALVSANAPQTGAIPHG